jgi:hypothetical protein
VAKSVGYLVSGLPADGIVRSVHARACNISCGESLLTLLDSDAADGPTTLLLDSRGAIDLRACFRVGDAVLQREGRLRSPRVEVDLSRATEWRPDPMQAPAEPWQVLANLRVAAARLAARPRCRASVIHREGRAVCARLEQACRGCDFEAALPEATRLIGWGEGLTPAGDDFLVGLMAGLDALSGRSDARREFLSRLGVAIVLRLDRTTPLAAHYLRLAAQGHFGAGMHRLRNVLVSANEVAPLERFVDDTLAVGATSGADLLAGLLSGIFAWLEHPLPARAAGDR